MKKKTLKLKKKIFYLYTNLHEKKKHWGIKWPPCGLSKIWLTGKIHNDDNPNVDLQK